VLHQRRQRLLDVALGLGVQRRGGLVEDQDRRVLEHGPGDGDALPLPAGQQHAAIADQGVEALGSASMKSSACAACAARSMSARAAPGEQP
jgi:hypothetical protein